jgi:uncharacterized protein YecE (DUF72 family)
MEAHVGCSGWFYWHWRGKFYPENSRPDAWFRHYTANFNTVELNAPFYRWPHLANVRGWVRQAPDNFRYSIKVNRIITHEKRLVRTRMLVEEFCKFSEILGEKLGCFLFQFPPSYRYTASRLRTITTQIDPSFRCAIEFRHSSWWRERVYDALRNRGLIFCTVSAPRMPDVLIRTNDVIYVRLHGSSRWYRHDYSDDELEAWSGKIRGSDARAAWIYFDNDRDAFAIKNAQTLVAKLRRRGIDVV